MLFPWSSRRQSGVLDVPQFAQLSPPVVADIAFGPGAALLVVSGWTELELGAPSAGRFAGVEGDV